MTLRTYQPTFTIERTFAGSVEKLWWMWTTKEGLALWYWPPPLIASVVHVDLRVGGGYEIAAAGMSHTSRGTYTEVVPLKRLASRAIIDFLPDLEPYERHDVIELFAAPNNHARMTFTSTRMHDEVWQQRSLQGFLASLDKLDRALEAGR
jgi:uncharacterized protein YndB with AHSA1/START domain